MDIFQEHYADIHAPGWQPRLAAQLRERGLVTFSGINGHAGLVAVAQRLMTVRPHRDAGPDGVTMITGTQAEGAGYAAFTDAELIPHTDGSSVPDPPGLLLLTCQQPAGQGGKTRVATAPASSARSPSSALPPCVRCPRRGPTPLTMSRCCAS
jgi:hypothetical protein